MSLPVLSGGGAAGDLSTGTADGGAKIYQFKLVLLGDTSVGKSCLVVRFSKDEFYELQESTIGAAFMTQSVDIGSCIVKFEIWDTAGQERYRSLAPMYYRGAAAAAIVYDTTRRDSFEGAKTWVKELQSIAEPSALVMALVGNKVDLESERAVKTEEAQQYADEQNILFMETSAKTGKNVNELFYEIARRLPKSRKEQDPNAGFLLKKPAKPEKGASWCSGCSGGA